MQAQRPRPSSMAHGARGTRGPAERPEVEVVRPPEISEDAVLRVLRVPAEAAGMRLDRFVQRELRNTSRTRSQLIISRGAYDADGRRLRKNQRLAAHQRVVLWREALDEEPHAGELRVLYEDQHLLAIDKPALVTVHPTARLHHSTLVKRLERQRPDEHVTLLHRLDRETSGVLLLARTREADRLVKAQFEERTSVVKRYLALTWGWPEWERALCELAIEPDLECPYRVKMRAVPAGEAALPTAASAGSIDPFADRSSDWIDAHGRRARRLPAATTFELCGRRHAPATGKRYALIRCTLHTGRQHQIRVHLSALGLSVVGDKLYGPDDSLFPRGADGELTAEDFALLELPRHALHAESLELDHPVLGTRLKIEAPFPPDLDAFWQALVPTR
jgi:23S rRNA pseudouridine1911/1915/1917 synthase